METKDKHLWHIAKKRAGFKRHLGSYIIVNSFLWIMWFFSSGKDNLDEFGQNGWPWPLWCTLGWGIGITFSYYNAYINNKESSVMREYQKLKEKQQNEKETV